MDKINIMHLRSGSGSGFYGAEFAIFSLCKNLNRADFDCILTCFKDPRLNEIALIEEAEREGIRTEIIELSFNFDLSCIFKLTKLLNKYNINILHCHDYKTNFIGFLASKFKEVKLVTTLHGWRRGDIREKIYEYLDSILIRNFDKIIVIFEENKKKLLEKGYAKNRIAVIHNGIDLNYFSEEKSIIGHKRKFGIREGNHVIGTIGRLSIEKGQRYFIEAMPQILKSLPNITFLIVGDGPLKKSLEILIYSLGLKENVILYGYCKRKELRSVYSIIDIFVSPSLAETISIGIMEAMAMGLPVIATNVGGTPLLIKHNETGYLIPPADREAIEKAVIELLKDRDKSAALAKNGQDFVKRMFSIDMMVKQTEKTYKSLT